MLSAIRSYLFGTITIEVTPEELFRASDNLSKDTVTINRQFDRIKSLVNNMAFYWEGAVSEKERNSYEKKYSEIVKMIEKINNYATELKLIAQNYSDTEIAATEDSQDLPSNVLS